ncbi:conserved hypothetical protein [Perkinsus marinus ATCC 50983]|uniref:TLDc domain-containing protein n=1 Tax=Perkinsus marinus (strain ATCC 50983 / TXsc) TaxID=423536 RepID=C5K897_PERM5|nr:conserved hypothetical protein [Perkinsus marinus ATCC 50983]EER19285.1 conserved hypothetical protein [Perkinsus marinus ATCC 50983]|eukprot:XP_002787489.1 conserved hypothetical protein [Perkinsus marinus ATCC 50983]
MATDEAVQVGTPEAVVEERGPHTESIDIASPCVFMREHAWFCTPDVKAPGLLTISESASTLHFEPDPRFERVRTDGMGAYQVYIDLRDLVECGAVTVPTSELEGESVPQGTFGHYGETDPDEYAAHFLQLQLSTLHGRRKHKIGSIGSMASADKENPALSISDDNVVVFQFPSREKLYKVAHRLIDIIDDIAEDRRVDGSPTEISTLTEVPFSCSAVVEGLAKMGLGGDTGRNAEDSSKSGIPPSASRVSVVAISDIQGSSSEGEEEDDEIAAPLLTIPVDDESALQYMQNHLQIKDPWLLTRRAAATLSDHLPIMLRFTQWTLSYSPKVHGISLDNFYRHMERMPCPSVLLIRDTEGTVFGALCMAQWRKSGKFCGNGESWVFTFGKHGYDKGDITVYPWSSKNEFFQYGDERRLVIGGGGRSGHSAICIYDSWLRGSTGHCLTYNSGPLASSEDFVIQDVEVWSLSTPEDD